MFKKILKKLFAITTLFSIYILPATAGANIKPIELNYETVGMPKEEIRNSSKDNSSALISKKTLTTNTEKKKNSFLNFLGLLLLSYALIEIAGGFDSDSSSTNNDQVIWPGPPAAIEFR